MRPLLAILLTLPLFAGCTEPDPTRVALLLAEESGSTPRGTRILDVETITDRVAAACKDCEVEVYDAGGDAAEQAEQLREAVTAESDLLVVWPVDPAQVEDASPEGVPMVSLVTLVPGSDQFVGFAEGEPDLPAQGTDLATAREIVLGKRKKMTFVPVGAMSEQAADVVVGQLAEKPLPGGKEHEGVPAWLYETAEVMIDNLTTVLVGQGILDLEELCEGRTAKRCAQLGLR